MQCVITFESVREKSKSVTIQKYFSAVFIISLKLIYDSYLKEETSLP